MPEEGTQVWEQLYGSLGFHVEDDEANGFALRELCKALCNPLQPVYDLVREREDRPGWSVLLDPDACPAAFLPYLAQYVGCVLTPEMSEQQQRNEIKQPTGWTRGSVAAIRIATRRTLTAPEGVDPLVIIHSRTPEAGHTYVRTLLSQTPEPDRTEAVVRAEVPAWNLLDYEAIEGVTVADVAASTNWETVADLAAAFSTVQALSEILPSEI